MEKYNRHRKEEAIINYVPKNKEKRFWQDEKITVAEYLKRRKSKAIKYGEGKQSDVNCSDWGPSWSTGVLKSQVIKRSRRQESKQSSPQSATYTKQMLKVHNLTGGTVT